MFNQHIYENSRPDGFPVLEIAETFGSAVRRFIPLKRTELKGELAGPLASLRLVQTYGTPAQPGVPVIEALYRFPLPGDAAVCSVRVCFGKVDICALLKERTHAERDYQEAKRQGRQAALVTRESPDVFTLRVAGIQPGEDVTIETAYVQLARAEGSGWSLRVPLTTAPRYVRSDELSGRHAEGQPLALLRDPGHRFVLDLTIQGAARVTSATHRVELAQDGAHKRVRLQGGEVMPDRDFVLSWTPVQAADRPALQVLLHDDPATHQLYFLALTAPPATHTHGRGVPREVVLLVDHSGSMEGAKWQAADWAVERFLSDLTSQDSFALGLFHDKTWWLKDEPIAATSTAVAEAVKFLKDHRDNGGTELGVALEQALALKRGATEAARHVLIISDAEVSDSGRILRLVEGESKRSDRRRISVLCIDAAPNAHLATELAEQGGGVARFLTSQPEEGDIATALDEVLADWAEPVLTGLRLVVNCPRAESADRAVLDAADSGWSAVDLGDLPVGRAIWTAGRVLRGEGDLTFRLRAAQQKEVAACRIDLNTAMEARPGLKALFGARRVRGLEYLIHSGSAGQELQGQLRRLGYDPAMALAEQPAKVYAENVREDATKALRGFLVREALDYGLASMETAFVAVRTEVGQPVQETVVVANALPSGWSEGFAMSAAAPMACKPPACRSLPADADIFETDFALPAIEQSGASVAAALAESDTDLESSDFCLTLEEDLSSPMADALSASPMLAAVLFRGVPALAGGEVVLFDSGEAGSPIPDQSTIDRLEVRFPDGTPLAESLDAGLCLLIFVDDMAVPRARVRLADIVRQRGERPLNLRKLAGQVVRIVLVDPAGVWSEAAPGIEVALHW